MEISKDSKELFNNARLGCTDQELADIFEVDVEDLAPYAILLRKARGELQMQIRKAFLQAAEKGNPVALTHLAAVYLRDSRSTSEAGSADEKTP